MIDRRMVRPAAAGMALMTGVTGFASPAQTPRFVALDKVEPGMWQLREVDGPSSAMCVRDPASLFQLRSRGAQCSRFVIDNGASSATVHYTCPGSGHGRTTISVETPQLLKIESEGIERGAPFSLEDRGAAGRQLSVQLTPPDVHEGLTKLV